MSNLTTLKLKKNYKQFNYYTEDKKFFIKKDSNEFILYNHMYEEMVKFKTLKDAKNCIVLLKNNPFKFLHESLDLDDYIDRCEKNILHFEVLCDDIAKNHYNNILKIAKEFKKIATVENLIISKSPYSSSFYAHNSSYTIDWGCKPENSYRFSDHWNFEDQIKDIIHCPTVNGEDYGLCICKYINGSYFKIL